MKLPAILASDLHLTANPRDEYRWGLFPWLAEELRAERAETLVLLGDLTDQKDLHPAELVNRVVREIDKLRAVVPRIIILMGNHDLLKSGHMFFAFLDTLPGVEVITKPTEDYEGGLTMWLPYSKQPATDWAAFDFSHFNYIMLHQTIKGAIASNGQKMEGEQLPDFTKAGKVYSGDIHVPQKIGPVEYVGSPYHVHFGDSFEPRCIAIDRDHRAFDLHYRTTSRVTLDVRGVGELRRITLVKGDQVKIRVHLTEAEKHEWRSVREEAVTICDATGVDLCGLELVVAKSRKRVTPGDRPVSDFYPQRAAYRFVEEQDLGGDLLDVGLECMEDQR